jgi:hypothetical protein
MVEELDHVESDREALIWAAGCLLAGLRERIKAMDVLQSRAARLLLAVPILFLTVRELFAPALTLAYFSRNTAVAQALGAQTPGDDYRRFIPLMEATPLWLQAVWVASGLLFLASAALLVFRRRSAFPVFVSALALDILGTLVEQSLPAYRETFSFATPNPMRDVVIPAAQLAIPLAIAALLWLMSRRAPAARPG